MSAAQTEGETLMAGRDMLDRLAHALLEHETLGEEEAYTAAGVASSSAETESLAGAS
jgi:hypothetical protein